MNTNFDLDNWFDSLFWPTYPRDLCNRVGSKSKALHSVAKQVKSQNTANLIMEGLREQMRYFRKLKQSGAHASEWKMGMAVTWLNGEHWADEIPSHYELAKKLESRKCKCGNDVEILDLCLICYEKIANKHDWRVIKCREYYVKNGLARKLSETRDNWLMRLKDTAKQQIAGIG